jgi:2-iminobutanoate/2-iminopropanoate deaminase
MVRPTQTNFDFMDTVFSEDAPKAIGPYAHATRSGRLLFCSGQTPLNPATMQIEGATVEEQTRLTLQNIDRVLGAAGITRKQVLKTTVFLKNFADFERMNHVYADFFGSHRPARTTVEVSRLPKDALVEIECVAEVPGVGF